MNKKIRRIALSAAMLLASIAFVLTLVAGTASAHSTHSTSSKATNGGFLGGDTMFRGGFFDLADGGGDYLLSTSHRYQLKFQSDGNLVEYDLGAGGRALWASHTTYPETCPGCGQGVIARMQQDGNFAIYDSQNHRVFATNTAPNGYKIVIQSDSNLVVYDQFNRALWARF